MIGSLRGVNPFEMSKINDLYGAGLPADKYEALLDSYLKVNQTLNEPLKQITEAMDIENFKFIYRYREYFKTLEFDFNEIKDWLIVAAEEKLIEMGVSKELVDS